MGILTSVKQLGFSDIALLLLFSATILSQPIQARSGAHRAAEQALGVKIVVDRIVPDTWQLSNYQPAGFGGETDAYLQILQTEFAKYPPGFLRRAHVSTIALARNYHFNGNHQAAMPDPYSGVLYLAIDGAHGIDSSHYLIHVMHHELNHMTEYAIWQDQYYKWPDWAALSPGFQYGDGGITAYSDTGTDYYSFVHPRPGFLNLYSMTGQEEDRSEIMAVLLTDEERPELIAICKKDAAMRKKVDLLNRLMQDFAEDLGGFPHLAAVSSECIGNSVGQ